MTSPSMCFKPIRELIAGINRHLAGWREYFKLGYPRRAFREIGWFVRERLIPAFAPAEPTALPTLRKEPPGISNWPNLGLLPI